MSAITAHNGVILISTTEISFTVKHTMFLLEPGSDAVQTKKLLCVLVQHAQQSERLCGERKASKKLNQDQMQGSIDGPSPSDCMQR